MFHQNHFIDSNQATIDWASVAGLHSESLLPNTEALFIIYIWSYNEGRYILFNGNIFYGPPSITMTNADKDILAESIIKWFRTKPPI